MRLKRGKSSYTLPNGISPSFLILHVKGIRYQMQQISNKCDFPIAVKGKPEPWPTVWNYENPWDNAPAIITIYPPPQKAWKLDVVATQEVVL